MQHKLCAPAHASYTENPIQPHGSATLSTVFSSLFKFLCRYCYRYWWRGWQETWASQACDMHQVSRTRFKLWTLQFCDMHCNRSAAASPCYCLFTPRLARVMWRAWQSSSICLLLLFSAHSFTSSATSPPSCGHSPIHPFLPAASLQSLSEGEYIAGLEAVQDS